MVPVFMQVRLGYQILVAKLLRVIPVVNEAYQQDE
jgi:hypothetical protein